MEEFHFIRPWCLLAIIPALMLCAALFRTAMRGTQWHEHIDQRLLPYLLDGKTTKAQKTPLIILCVLWVIASLAIAGPTWERKEQPVQRDTSALVILWDLSPSMYAQDVKPSRLVRARLKLMDVLNSRKEGLTALITYSGDAHVVTPLTDDTRTIKSLLPGIDPSIMPEIGNNPEAALERALKLLQESSITKGTILFVTDGIPESALPTLRSTVRPTLHRVAVWGIGTEIGAPIPLPQGGFFKNSRGEIIVAKTDVDTLSDAAIEMRGIFVPFSDSQHDIDTIVNYSSESYAKETEKHNRQFDQWLDMGPWLALFMLPFAMLAFRKGWVLGVVFLGFFVQPETSYAFQWNDLWQTKDQQGQALIKENDFENAAETFENPEWKAVADYKSGNFESASEQFSKGSTAADFYNLANSLTHQGEYDKAIAAFDEALKRNPEFSEAQDNKTIAEQLKQLQEQQQNQSEQQNGENQESGENQQEQNSQNSQNQQGENQQGDNQQGDNQQSQNSDSNESQSNAEQSEGEQSQEDQDNGEQSQQSAQQSEMTEEQKQALQQHYQQKENEDENTESDQQLAQQQEEQAQQENPEQMTEQQIATMQMSNEEKEQQQALQQWLRKVPDDPSGLLRNKFRYEYQKRLRESQSTRLRAPGEEDDERW